MNGITSAPMYGIGASHIAVLHYLDRTLTFARCRYPMNWLICFTHSFQYDFRKQSVNLPYLIRNPWIQPMNGITSTPMYGTGAT